MTFLEKDLEEIVFNNRSECYNRGLWSLHHSYYIRQLNLGEYGIADIVGITVCPPIHRIREVYITVYELKQDMVDANTLMQAFRYCTGIRKIVEKSLSTIFLSLNFKVCLIGRKIQTNGDFVFLLNDAQNVSAYTYKYDFNGIYFTKESGYAITDASVPLIKDSYKTNILSVYKNHFKKLLYGKDPNSKAGTLE